MCDILCFLRNEGIGQVDRQCSVTLLKREHFCSCFYLCLDLFVPFNNDKNISIRQQQNLKLGKINSTNVLSSFFIDMT